MRSPSSLFSRPYLSDWDDCPNRKTAWMLWEKHFLGFENNWYGTEKFAPFQGSVVQRQSIRKENFAFVTHGVLFFSLHWLGGASGAKDSRTAERMAHNNAWIEEQATKHKASIESGRIRAVIIAGHALTRSDSSLNTLQVIKDSFEGYDIPVVFFKGDKHTFEVCESFLGIGWEKFKIVQVYLEKKSVLRIQANQMQLLRYRISSIWIGVEGYIVERPISCQMHAAPCREERPIRLNKTISHTTKGYPS